MAGTYEVPAEGSPNTTEDPKIKAFIKGWNESLGAGNKLEGKEIVAESIKNAQLAAEAKPFDWYTPKIIATEQTRESATFGTLTTPDEITGVVLPENGLIVVGYSAKVKSSVASEGRVAVFLGANQLRNSLSSVQENSTSGTGYNTMGTSQAGISGQAGTEAFVTTGQIVGAGSNSGGPTFIFAAAGTYTVSIQYKAVSGSITAKERKLWVGVMGV